MMTRIEADGLGENGMAGTRGLRLPSPLLILALAVVACVLLLMLPLTLPVGAMYWDLVVYLDGAQRVLDGQVPAIDFFAPVGPIGYWLMAAGLTLFPQGQMLLVVQWSLLALTAPLMAMVLWDVDRRSRSTALGLLLPFLAFQLMPMNVEQYSVFPSVDGYGIYNRHVVNLLYVLTAALVFVRSQAIMLAVVFAACLFLFLLKVTGFLSAGLLCLFALLAGRVRFSAALVAAALFLASLAALEVLSGIVSAYVADILVLVGLNTGTLAPRFLQAASIHFGIFGSGCLLVLALLVLDRKAMAADLRAIGRGPFAQRMSTALDRPVLWLGVGLLAGLFFETQNTGGQAFVFIWPILLLVLFDTARFGSRSTILILTLVAATALPPFVNTTHRFARAMIGQFNYVALEHEHLGTLGSVSQRPEAMERGRWSLDVYAAHPETFEDFSEKPMLSSVSLYSELDFQIAWLMASDEAVGAILDYEAANGVRFDTIMNLNFGNPFPYLLGRSGTRHIAIGADPFRAVPEPDAETLAAVADTDLILYPTCPITPANNRLREFYAAGMEGHEPVRLSRCWIGYVKR